MANDNPPTNPPPEPPAAKAGDVKLQTRRGYNYIDGDFVLMEGETVSVSAGVAKKLLTKAPDYLVVAKEDKEQ